MDRASISGLSVNAVVVWVPSTASNTGGTCRTGRNGRGGNCHCVFRKDCPSGTGIPSVAPITPIVITSSCIAPITAITSRTTGNGCSDERDIARREYSTAAAAIATPATVTSRRIAPGIIGITTPAAIACRAAGLWMRKRVRQQSSHRLPRRCLRLRRVRCSRASRFPRSPRYQRCIGRYWFRKE